MTITWWAHIFKNIISISEAAFVLIYKTHNEPNLWNTQFLVLEYVNEQYK